MEVVVEEAPSAVEVSPNNIDVTTHASTEPSFHIYGAFPGGLTDRSVLIRYADYVTLCI